jgi:hypothetical protein
MLRRLALSVFFSVLVALALGCGGSAKDGVSLKGPADVGQSIDADPLALLPGSAVVLAQADAKAFFASGVVGAQVAQLVEKVIPIGDEAGFKASRDVDTVYAGVYALQGADAVAVLVGRFEEEKIKKAADAHVQLKGGGTLVASQYAGRSVYTIGNVGFSVLTAKTALVGTETGMRRALDRIREGRIKREALPWMVQTLETPGATAAAAADFSGQQIPAQLLQQLPLPWLKDMKAARALASFKENGTQVAGSITYGDAAQAGSAAGQLRQAQSLTALLSLIGLRIQNMDIQTDQSDVKFSAMVDDQSMRVLVANLPRWLGM